MESLVTIRLKQEVHLSMAKVQLHSGKRKKYKRYAIEGVDEQVILYFIISFSIYTYFRFS